MAETYMSGRMASTSMSSLEATTPVPNKDAKRTIVLVGCVVIVLLAIVDSVLLYFWFTAPPQARARSAAALRDRTGYDGDESEDAQYPILFDFADPRKMGGLSGAWRLCTTSGCSWLEAYMAAHSAEVSDPCDDFYAHACARHDRSVYDDGRARLMDAVVDVLLDRSLVSATPGDVVARVARRNRHRGETRGDHLDMLKLCLSGDQPTVSTSDFDRQAFVLSISHVCDCENTSQLDCPSRVPLALTKASVEFFRKKVNASMRDYADFIKRATFPLDVGEAKSKSPFGFRDRALRSSVASKEWFRRACQWISLAARCHLPENLGRSDADIRAYQRAWKALYFAPFLGPQANPLLSLLYGNAPEPRVRACLTIMADVFENATLAAAKQVLEEAVDDLEGSLSQLGRDARLAMHEFTEYVMTGEAPDFEELALPGGTLSQDKNDDLKVALVDSYYGSAKNMDIFASQARYVESDRRRLLLVTPGLVGLLVNVSSSVEPVLVPALAKPLLRAMLAAWKPEQPSEAAPPAKILKKLSRCFATWVNVSEPLSAEVAAEVVILEPLFHLYRKRLAESIGDNTILQANYTNQQLFFFTSGHTATAVTQRDVNSSTSWRETRPCSPELSDARPPGPWRTKTRVLSRIYRNRKNRAFSLAVVWALLKRDSWHNEVCTAGAIMTKRCDI
ncbi:hypothetical protein MTO96_037068 [Rhipicephalus appendiculatus]